MGRYFISDRKTKKNRFFFDIYIQEKVSCTPLILKEKRKTFAPWRQKWKGSWVYGNPGSSPVAKSLHKFPIPDFYDLGIYLSSIQFDIYIPSYLLRFGGTVQYTVRYFLPYHILGFIYHGNVNREIERPSPWLPVSLT